MKVKRNKKPLIIVLILIILVFSILYFFKDEYFLKKENDVEEITEKQEIVKTISFTLAGNVLINSEMWYDTSSGTSYDFSYMFEYLNDIMKKSDFNMYTEESIIGGSELGRSVNAKYNTPKEILSAMSNIGFNAVSIATNHSFDKGEDGVNNSIKYLDESNMIYSGLVSEKNTNIFEKDGIKVALFSYTMSSKVSKADSFVNIYTEEKVKTDIEGCTADIIVVSIDWCGYESSTVDPEQEEIVKYLSSLGVDIVVGNNDSVIEPIQMVDNTLVCYSLGNLMSGHSKADNRISALVDFKVNVTELAGEKSISFDDINVLFSYGYNYDSANYRVIPFSKLTNELSNYKTYYDKYSEIIKGIDSINIYPIGE